MSILDPDVTCLLQGRLGNNLFEVAATIAYATRHGLSWAVPAGYHIPDIYEFGMPVTTEHQSRNVWREPSFRFTPIAPMTGRIFLFGFFQSYMYFLDQQQAVREAFKLERVPPSPRVSIHVRRTDLNQHGECFRYLPLSYYGRAVSHFVNNGFHEFRVFSDDLSWCVANLPGLSPKADFEFCSEVNPRRALSLMAACRHHIIANSSFSWWGAWLNPRGKTVIAPNHRDWFGEYLAKQHDTVDLLPVELEAK